MVETTRVAAPTRVARPWPAHRRLAHAGVVVTVAALVACSGGARHPSPAPPTTPAASGRPSSSGPSASVTAAAGGGSATPDGGDIVVEGIATVKNHPDADVGFQARVNRFNKAGGLAGRQVKFLGVKDDGLDPSQDLSLLKSLIDDDHVVAVAPVATEAMLAPSAAFLTQRGVTAVGLGTSPAFCGLGGQAVAPGVSPDGCELNPAYASSADLAHVEQATGLAAAQIRLAIIGDDLDADKARVQALAASAKAQNVQVVYQGNDIVTQGPTDYAPVIRSISAAVPNVVYEMADFGGSVALAGVLHAAGYIGAVFNHVTYAAADSLAQAGIAATLANVYVDAPYPLDVNTGNPAVAQMQADLQAIGRPPQIDLASAAGYWAADMLIQLMQAAAARGGPVTAASLSAVAAAGWTYTGTPGGPADLTFPTPGWIAPGGCSTLTQLVGTGYKEVVPYGCAAVAKVG